MPLSARALNSSKSWLGKGLKSASVQSETAAVSATAPRSLDYEYESSGHSAMLPGSPLDVLQ